MACDVHCALLYQPGVSELGTKVRLHLDAFLLACSVRIPVSGKGTQTEILTSKSAWVFFFLPEVKDRSLEEIDEMVSLAYWGV